MAASRTRRGNNTGQANPRQSGSRTRQTGTAVDLPPEATPQNPNQGGNAAALELTQMREELERIRREAEEARAERDRAVAAQQQAAAAMTAQQGQRADREVEVLVRPKGDAGRHFKLAEAMGLEDDMDAYRAIQRTVHHAAFQSGIDLSFSFRSIPPEKLANIYKRVRDSHEYMDRRRFPGDWPTGELLKQFLKNHRKYGRKKGRFEPYANARHHRSSSPLPNVDDD